MKKYKFNAVCLQDRIADHPMTLLGVSLIIMVIEFAFLIWDFASGYYTGTARVIYTVAHLVSFAVALIISFYAWQFHKKEANDKRVLYWMTFGFETILNITAALISFMDLMENNGCGVIVYITFAIGIPCISLIDPVYYAFLSVGVSLALLLSVYFCGGVVTSGLIVNFVIFLVLLIWVCLSLYWLISSNYRNAQKLTDFSFRDQLTGLFNRRSLDQKIEALAKTHPSYAFVLTDIDNFKEANDKLGHAKGDEVLKRVSSLMTKQFGENVYRYGGDEIAVITSDDEKTIREKAAYLNNQLRNYDSTINITISFGIYFSTKEDDIMTPFICADKALYISKDIKGSCTVYKE